MREECVLTNKEILTEEWTLSTFDQNNCRSRVIVVFRLIAEQLQYSHICINLQILEKNSDNEGRTFSCNAFLSLILHWTEVM